MEILQIVAFGVFVTSIIIALIIRLIWKKRKNLIIVTVGVFVLWCLIWFASYVEGKSVDDIDYIYCMAKMIFSTLEIFTFKVPVDSIKQITCYIKNVEQECFTRTLYLLYFFAPMLIVGNIIAFFRDFTDKFRFAASVFLCNRYIMSEINTKSIEMAKSIKKMKGNPIIIFTDSDTLSKTSDEDKLIEQVRDLDAICLKRKLTDVKLRKIFGKDEVFLIGEDETQNISQAIVLTNKYKKRLSSIAIYVYYHTNTAIEIIDSIDKGENVLDRRFVQIIENNPGEVLDESWEKWKKSKIEGKFFISCFNPVEQTIIKIVSENYIIIHNIAKKEKVIVVSIVGMGRYGLQFFKIAMWIFQLYGYRLQVNIIDWDEKISKQVESICPELIKKNGTQESGDSSYEIHFYTGVDCCTFELEEVLNSIKKSQMFFVALGQDDKNIDVAMRIRRFFAKEEALNNARKIEETDEKQKQKEETPIIYAVVSNDQMSKVASNLSCFDGQSYNIHFVGSFSEENSYDKIEEKQELEKLAFIHHIEWINKDGENISESLLKKAQAYVNYSYYRNSSTAQAVYKKCLKGIICEIGELLESEEKKKEEFIRISEHMRWNMYMRMQGYSYAMVRNDRARIHNKLVPFESLSRKDQTKDDIDIKDENME